MASRHGSIRGKIMKPGMSRSNDMSKSNSTTSLVFRHSIPPMSTGIRHIARGTHHIHRRTAQPPVGHMKLRRLRTHRGSSLCHTLRQIRGQHPPAAHSRTSTSVSTGTRHWPRSTMSTGETRKSGHGKAPTPILTRRIHISHTISPVHTARAGTVTGITCINTIAAARRAAISGTTGLTQWLRATPRKPSWDERNGWRRSGFTSLISVLALRMVFRLEELLLRCQHAYLFSSRTLRATPHDTTCQLHHQRRRKHFIQCQHHHSSFLCTAKRRSFSRERFNQIRKVLLAWRFNKREILLLIHHHHQFLLLHETPNCVGFQKWERQ
jgi:hypothetical protein